MAWLREHALIPACSALAAPLGLPIPQRMSSDMGTDQGEVGHLKPDGFGRIFFNILNLRQSKLHLVPAATASGRRIPERVHANHCAYLHCQRHGGDGLRRLHAL